jgi:electron-transferring-flavoprotein dehydrogenase
MTSVALTGTNHAENQPVHLRVVKTAKFIDEVVEKKQEGNWAVGAGVDAVETEAEALSAEDQEMVEEELETRRKHVQVNVGEYAGLLGRACPAGVYEYVAEEGSDEAVSGGWNGHKLVINSQVRIYCFQFISFKVGLLG